MRVKASPRKLQKASHASHLVALGAAQEVCGLHREKEQRLLRIHCCLEASLDCGVSMSHP